MGAWAARANHGTTAAASTAVGNMCRTELIALACQELPNLAGNSWISLGRRTRISLTQICCVQIDLALARSDVQSKPELQRMQPSTDE